MIQFKVTNTYGVTEDGESKVRVRGRTEDGESESLTVSGIKPNFYATTDVVKEKEDSLIRQENVKDINHDVERDAWLGENVSEIVVEDHYSIGKVASDNFEPENRYESNKWFRSRFRIQGDVFTGIRSPSRRVHISEIELVDIDDFRTRICYCDIETDDRGEFKSDGERPIISIVAQDSYTSEVVGFFWTDGRDIENCFPNGRPDKLDKLHYSETESQMLDSFSQYIQEHDPDMLTGWNFRDFDARYLIQRYPKVGKDADSLAREGSAKVTRRKTPVIQGREIYDLQEAWKRTKRNEPDSTALDNVAQQEIGAEKIDHTGMGYYQMWEEDPEKLMNYNAQDVILCKDLNDQLGVVEFWGTLGDVVGVDFQDTRANNTYIEMMTWRKLDEKDIIAPVANYKREKSEYEGGFVFDPYYGRAENVIGIDLSSLYPNTMAMGNISPDTKVTPEEAKTLKRAGIPVCKAPNGAHFRLDQDGLFKELVDEAIGLKEDYKQERKEAKVGTEEHDKAAEKYGVAKTVTNSLYGVTGWEPFFLYDEEVAEAVTLLGQECIRKTGEWIEENTEAEIVYGDTDSNYIKFPDHYDHEEVIERTQEICETLDNEVYPEFAESFGIPGEMNRWQIEPEALMETFFQSGQKKFYAYKAVWDEGEWLDDPEYTIKGYGFKKSSSSELTQDVGYKLMKAILDGKEKSELSDIIHKAAQDIDPVSPDWEKIGIPQGLGKELHEKCDCDSCYNWSATGHHPKGAHPRGAWFMNRLSQTSRLEQGSKPKRVYVSENVTVNHNDHVEQVDVISFEDHQNIPDDVMEQLEVDTGEMTEKLIIKPFDTILEAVDIDVQSAIQGQHQTGFGAFM